MAKLVESMVELGMSEDDVHMIGVGMGAHMLSYAGNTFALKGKPIGRITGINVTEQ